VYHSKFNGIKVLAHQITMAITADQKDLDTTPINPLKQAGTAVLAQANQVPQTVLALLR
jgi:flagellin-like hook-associated protein FlgL